MIQGTHKELNHMWKTNCTLDKEIKQQPPSY